MDKLSGAPLTMTIPEVARALGISRGLAYELAKQDKLPVKALRLGEKRLVIPRKALEEALADKQQTAFEYHDDSGNGVRKLSNG